MGKLPWEGWIGNKNGWWLRDAAWRELAALRSDDAVTYDDLQEETGLSRDAIAGVLTGGTGRMQSVQKLLLAHRALLTERASRERLTDEWIWEAVLRPRQTVSNLPGWLGTLVGRETMFDALRDALRESPVVTLTGPSGIGKSTLAQEYARACLQRSWDGVFAIDVGDAASEAEVVAAMLRGMGIREKARVDGHEALRRYLGEARALVTLDRCDERLAEVGRTIEAVLDRGGASRFLVAAQRRLGIAGERAIRVPPLAVSGPSERESPKPGPPSAAERMYLALAPRREGERSFDDEDARAIPEVCALLGGIPGAIALAARRPPAELLRDLRDRRLPEGNPFEALTRRTVERLTPDEAEALAQLAVFEGGFDRESAEALVEVGAGPVRADAVFDSLWQQGLVQRYRVGERGRYRLLDATRQAALAQAEARRGVPAMRGRHARRYLVLARRAEPHLGGPQTAWLTLIDLEYENVLGAFRVADAPTRLRIAAALRRYWYAKGLFAEGRARLVAALDGWAEAGPERAKALAGLAALRATLGDFEAAKRDARASLEICGSSMPDVAAEAHNTLGFVAHHVGDLVAAGGEFERSRALLELSGHARWFLVNATNNLAATLNERERYADAERVCDENAALAGTIKYEHGRATALTNLSVALLFQDKWDKALPVCEQAMIHQEPGSRPRAHSLVNRGLILTELDRFADAARSLKEALDTVVRQSDPRATAIALGEIGALLSRAGDHVHAARLLRAAERRREESRCPLPPNEAKRIDRYLALTRETLGEPTFDAQVYLGVRLTEEEAVGLALDRCRVLSD